MSGLEVRGLVKDLGRNRVVDGVSFQIKDGEFFVLLGASGSGKSTLLRLICGLEEPDEGEVWVANREITRLPPRERNLGMVFQDYGLYPNMDVYENIAYGLEAKRLPRGEIEERVTQAAERLGLTPLLRRPIVDLSGGEQQRVALARALARDADAYLFDEPLSNLDPKLRYQARRDIMTIHRQKNRPSLYVTHDQSEAIAMGDRIGVLAEGRLQQVGSADDLLQRPANLHVARFVGSPPMNLIDGKIRREGDQHQFVADGLVISLPAHWQSVLDGYNKPEVVAGLRPEAILLAGSADAAEATAIATFTAHVEDVEALIGETALTLRLGNELHLDALLDDEGDLELAAGERHTFAFDSARLCLFDPGSEVALG
jgi:multiple sugar transport system ATP-binding protein